MLLLIACFSHMHLVFYSDVSSPWAVGKMARTVQCEQSSWVAMGSEDDRMVSELF